MGYLEILVSIIVHHNQNKVHLKFCSHFAIFDNKINVLATGVRFFYFYFGEEKTLLLWCFM